jgi:three-Cys-motif partner protein
VSRITTTVWPLDPHTAAKHAILRRYLNAWIPIMSRYNERVLYIDGFAGPGIYQNGEPGSPIIALDAALAQEQHIRGEIDFLFIEADRKRYEHLERQLKERSLPTKFSVEAVHGRFDETLKAVLDPLPASGKQLIPTFAFVDPFGFSHTPMSVIAGIMRNPRCEVLITFMYEESNRFLSHEDHPATFDALFGCDAWRACLQHGTPVMRERCIRDAYQRQLLASGIKHVRAFKMRNRDNRTDYFLFFGTNNLIGLAKMKESMWRVDQRGEFEFSDATNADQILLFADAPDFGVLRRQLQRLAGKTLPVEQIEEFVLTETAFTASHYKRVLRELELSSPPGLAVRAAKEGRKRGFFPAGTIVKFFQGGLE